MLPRQHLSDNDGIVFRKGLWPGKDRISAVPGWFNESWTFILDSNGAVSQRFEGYASLEELEEALKPVDRQLGDSS